MLLIMGLLMLGSIWNQSATMDELAHIPAGFGYISQLDYRLNPEHPPLIKALAALSARIAVNPHFPTDTRFWRDDINGQWDQGTAFLYESGNDADKIIFWSRFPLIILTLVFGWLFFVWARSRFGDNIALLALTFFVFSPNLLAHSSLVTTDLGAAFGFFIGIATFIRFLEAPSWRNLFIAGVAFGIAQLLKYSVVLLIPIYGVLILLWALSRPSLRPIERMSHFLGLMGKTIIIGLIGVLIIWAVYTPFVWNYPQERNARDAKFLLGSYGFRPAVDLDLLLIQNPVTRPLGEYFLGLLMVRQRSVGGNTAYFLGEVSASGSLLYFPILYFVKEPLPFLILLSLTVIWALRRIRHATKIYGMTRHERVRRWIENNFMETTALVFIAFYWMLSIASPLNIGLRHVLPTLPFIYLLVAREFVRWIGSTQTANPRTIFAWLRGMFELYIKVIPKYIVLFILIVWLIIGTIVSFPHYLSYYNILGGGTNEGYNIAVDSNYDWGQDLKRLKDYVEENGIAHIAIDYFGAGNPRYYLGNRFEPWWSARGKPEHGGYFAISATFRQGAFGTPVKGFLRKPEDSYEWLKQYEPIARAGKSIFIYKLPEDK